MGLGNNAGSGIFLTISNGKICRQLQAPSADSIERTNKIGKTVHEEFYDHVSGKLVDISTREHPEFGKDWNITIEDDGQRYILQCKYSSGYASGFLKALPNADLTQPITIIPNLKEDNGKKKTTIFLSQGGHALKWFYTKENPNGLPQMKKIKVKGQETWDDTDMMEFLENMVNNEIKPQLSGKEAELVPAEVGGNGAAVATPEEDAPF